jgi:hypothetical protein
MRLSARPWGHAAATGGRNADQTKIRGGCSGGGWPRPSGQASFCSGAILPEAANGGWNKAAETPAKHWLMQAAIKTHWSQPIGAGAFDGQHGMSRAMASAVADIDISSAVADGLSDVDISSASAAIDASEGIPATAWRDSGASTSPTITAIASRRPMSRRRFITKHHTGSRRLEGASLHMFASGGSDRQKRQKITWLSRPLPSRTELGLRETRPLRVAAHLRDAR